MSDDLHSRTAAIAAALSSAKPALDGPICANCAHRKRSVGRLACGNREGPKYAESVQPADTCSAFYDNGDAAEAKRHHAVVGSTVGGAAFGLAEEAAIDESHALAAKAAEVTAPEPAKKGKAAKEPGKRVAKTADGGAGGGHKRTFIKALPEGCPVKPLGIMGQTYYYISARNQLEEIAAEKHGRLVLSHLFGGNVDYMSAWVPAINKQGVVTGPQYESIGASLMKICNERGLWDKRDRVRGRGCWHGDKGLIMHLGHRLVYGSDVLDPGEIEGHVYPEGQKLMPPADTAAHPGADILKLFQSWNWKRAHLDPLLMLGWLTVAPLGASLKVRPMLFATGGYGTGKSTLNKAVEYLLGGWLLWSNDATSASITAALGLDCLPVAVDENENRPDSNRALQMIETARLSYSGGTKRRSDAQHKAHEFTLRSAMFFSAINPPAMELQDKSRFAILKLHKLDMDAPRLDLQEPVLRGLGQRLLARIIADQSLFDARFNLVAEALRKAGHDSRGQDTFGTLLTAAWCALGDDAIEALALPLGKRLNELTAIMHVDDLHETAGRVENWRECLDHLVGAPVEAFRNSKRQTIGAVLDAMLEQIKAPIESGLSFQDANDLLKQTGVMLIRPKANGDPIRLFVPHTNEQVQRLFRGSKWFGIPGHGGWSMALEQAPNGLWQKDRQRVNKATRGLSFSLDVVMEEPGAEVANGQQQETWI
jgi:hypothetical protein